MLILQKSEIPCSKFSQRTALLQSQAQGRNKRAPPGKKKPSRGCGLRLGASGHVRYCVYTRFNGRTERESSSGRTTRSDGHQALGASIRFQLAFHGKQQLDQTGEMQNAYLRSGKGGVGGFLGQYGFISYLWGGTVFP